MNAIEFENISKQYRLGLVSTRTLSHDLQRWWAMNILRKEDPYLKVGETNDRATRGQSEYVWALRDINLKVEQGDVVGIIGKNGSGKSTLLKLLSKVTAPTTGTIKARGRIASLLEVGTGFHPEMTGRENIYMNGAIMGMTRAEITRKLDEIVAFSGCERYIDTPVKRYSSGMTVRLGFAIAAHLEPDILIVDEVLAVGDAEFQKKAIGKMQDVSQGQGRTVLFVSHNMASIRSLCKTGVLLENGEVAFTGRIGEVVDYYLDRQAAQTTGNNAWPKESAPGGGVVKIKSAYVSCAEKELGTHTDFDIVTEFWVEEDGFRCCVNPHVYNAAGLCVFNISTEYKNLNKGLHKSVTHIPKGFMNNGYYSVDNMFVVRETEYYTHKNAHSFELADVRENAAYGRWIGAVRPTFIKMELE